MVPRFIMNFDPSRLKQISADYLVVGSGIAGLYTALKAVEHGRVLLVTKKKIGDSNTEYAQGGIAAAIAEEDSPLFHLKDTLVAGAGLCELGAVEVLVTEGPARIEELIRLGTAFDTEDGDLALTREGGHGRRRILHASGDATGEEIRRSLWNKCMELNTIEVFEQTFMVDLLLDKHGECTGVLALDNRTGELLVIRAKVTVLATGGSGQLYKYSTNPDVATGDGIAAAYRAGAEVMDMEFFQFHPTALALPGLPRFLISEAVRGEGGILRNAKGERFMEKYHELKELAPRDVVSLAIWKEMDDSGANQVYLDLTHLDPEMVKSRFPTISKTTAGYGLDITKEYIPVAPAAHYTMGGIRTDLDGRTNILRLFACGESACTGVHGANRLASNSLLEGLVFGHRIVEASLPLLTSAPGEPDRGPGPKGGSKEPLSLKQSSKEPLSKEPLPPSLLIQRIQEIMWDYVGLWRSAEGLETALELFAHLEEEMGPLAECTVESIEGVNLLLLGQLTARSALLRTESRGGHYRKEYPERRDDLWLRHIIHSR